MSEPKFSKEPWATWSNHHEMADTGDFYDEIGVKSEFNGRQICICCDCDDDDEIKANAALMTQSPVMYKSLEEDMKFLRSTAKWLAEHMGLKNTAIVESMFYRADKIDELLAKARNEQ